MIASFANLLLFISIIWLIVLTFITTRFYGYYQLFTKNGKKDSMIELMNNVIKKEEQLEKAVVELRKKCDTLEKESFLHIQKIGLLRFNPFKDTGGDQSFILAFVDAHDTGVIISSLHTRSGTRWYAKKVVRGKGMEYELSDEEAKALKESTFLDKI